MNIVEFPSKAKKQIHEKFPPVAISKVPKEYELAEINYKTESIEQYEVIFWYRLLKGIYQEPLEVDCELEISDQATDRPVQIALRRLEKKSQWELLNANEEIARRITQGELRPIPLTWKFFISLPGDAIIEISSRDRNTSVHFSFVVSKNSRRANIHQAEQFISLLLAEARKEENQIFKPKKEFNNTSGLRYYHLWNVYLSNYVSGEFMLEEGLTQEKSLRSEYLKYDMRTSEIYDDRKKQHIDKFSLTCGVYFSSAVSYFFISLEGFINIVFHCFLRPYLRDKNLNIEERFDIEQKLQLMSSLCEGFKRNSLDSKSDVHGEFRKLKKYRNRMFHAKVDESLRTLGFMEDGFLYNCDVSRYGDQFLPAQKMMLSAKDVLKVKQTVDEIIQVVLLSMNNDTRRRTEKYILKSTHIPVFAQSEGRLFVGGKQNNYT